MKRYVLAGTGDRGTMAFAKPMTEHFKDCALLCGLFDRNGQRAGNVAAMLAYSVPVFESFDEMLKMAKPDVVIVTTVDAAHDEYIISALEADCDVISEKPLTTDEHKLRAICEAEKRTGKKVTVTFNCRFLPLFMRVKELLNAGVIGDVLSAHYEWLLDTEHGADYFRRWHRERKNSGSLLIHKSTHHFDILNWLLGDTPEKVNAFGSSRFYGKNGISGGVNCRNCSRTVKCPFYWNIENDTLSEFYKSIYTSCEDGDGYLRDKCVFSDEIDIEDSVSLNIRYKSGVSATYSLTAHSPYEGAALMLNGSKGRLELSNIYEGGAFAGLSTKSIKVYNRYGEEVVYNIPKNHMTETMREVGELSKSIDVKSGHGGSDAMLRQALFRGISQDPLGQMADLKAGAYSVGIGIAANISMYEDRAVRLDEFMEHENW